MASRLRGVLAQATRMDRECAVAPKRAPGTGRRTRWAATRGASYDMQRFVVESAAAVVQGAAVAAAAEL